MNEADVIRVVLYGLGCAGIAVAMFCRAVHMERLTTWTPMRVAVFAGGCASVYGIYAVCTGYVPGWSAVGIVLAWLLALLVSSRSWRAGLPAEFRRSAL